MAGFSGGEALSSGFRLIRERPGAVLIWGGVYFVLAVLPQFAMLGLVAPDFMAIAQAGEGVEPDAALQQAMALNAKMAVIQPVQLVCSFGAAAVLYCAVFRAVLRPEDSRFGYVRFGAQELWVGLVLLVSTILLMFLVFALVIPLVVVATVSAVAAPSDGGMSPAGAVTLLAGVAAVFGVLLWLAARFSLAYPMSFAERKFLLFEAWPLTKGHALKIIQVFLAAVAVILIVELMLFVLAVIVFIAAMVAGGRDVAETLKNLPADWVITAAPWLVIGAAFMSILSGAAYAVMAAPLASIYRQLAAGAQPATAP